MAQFRGFAFPFQRGDDGQIPAPAEDEELIAASIAQILRTPRGSRLMRPGYGSSAESYVFEPNDTLLETNMRNDVRNALARHEPRIQVVQIDVLREETTITLTIQYVIRATRQVNTFTQQYRRG